MRAMRAAFFAIVNTPVFAGIARTLDIGGALNEPHPYERYASPEEAGAATMFKVWRAVGEELEAATRAFDPTVSTHGPGES